MRTRGAPRDRAGIVLALTVSDTHPDAERTQIDLLRRATLERRMELLCSMTHFGLQMSRRAIAQTMPGASEQEVLLRWAAIHYGADLAERVRRYLDSIATG